MVKKPLVPQIDPSLISKEEAQKFGHKNASCSTRRLTRLDALRCIKRQLLFCTHHADSEDCALKMYNQFQDSNFYFGHNAENWAQFHHHRSRSRKLGPYLVPSDPYLYQLRQSEYFLHHHPQYVHHPVLPHYYVQDQEHHYGARRISSHHMG